MSDEGMSDAAMTPDEIARAYLKSAIENKQAQFDKCTREVSAFMAADDVNLATFTRRWESARVEAETTLRVYETLRDIVANGDEYREQHENLLSVRQSDLTALTARLDTITATLVTVTAERDALAKGWLPIDIAPDDGTDVLVCVTHNMPDGEWETIQWVDWQRSPRVRWPNYAARIDIPFPPTHWMPLPAPPNL